MAKSKVLVICISALGFLVAAILWKSYSTIPSARGNANAVVALSNSVSAPNLVPTNAIPPSVPIVTPPVAQSARASRLSDKYNSALDLGTLYAELDILARLDPEAAYFMGKILETCTMFVGPFLERLEERVARGSANLDQKAAVGNMKARCQAVPVQTVKIGSTSLIREAALQGDAKAQAYLYRFEPINIGEKSAADTMAVRGLALSRDPLVLENLDGYFYVRNQRLVWTIPGMSDNVSGEEVARAFLLVACDLGADCSSLSIEAQIMCANRGWCDSGGRSAQLQNNLSSPSSFARTMEVRRVIHEGFATGRWPPGFWSGVPGVVKKVN